MNRPFGIIKHNGRLSERAYANLRESVVRSWGAEYASRIVILEEGMDFVQLKQPEALPVPDAICLHCGRANLGTSYQCLGCNAPLVHGERQ